jgi:hypothetical protein
VPEADRTIVLMLRIIKKAFLWNYERTTWQWDVLCVVILAFIFLTPKSWFVSHAVSTVLMDRAAVEDQKEKGQLEQRVRALTGKQNAQIVEVRPRQDSAGKTVGYEVDIR